MRIGVHLRPGSNRTNPRSEALGRTFESLGHEVVYSTRETPVRGSELVVQTGFNATVALLEGIERRIPYIIMEAPYFRDFYDIHKASSWGYNGLAGGSWRPEPPPEERAKPILQPMKTEGGILIVGQKPTDHSLRGTDHVQWLLDRFVEFPDAEFRPHPLMVPHGSLEPLEECLRRNRKVITYTSTAGVEALVAGCEVRADGLGSICSDVRDREGWLHSLSWAQGRHQDFDRIGSYILSGYDEARERAKCELVEHPRRKVNGQAICERYYRSIIRGATP